jgi:hypothetical protein
MRPSECTRQDRSRFPVEMRRTETDLSGSPVSRPCGANNSVARSSPLGFDEFLDTIRYDSSCATI